jgi:lysophospholipase L1-like esterase
LSIGAALLAGQAAYARLRNLPSFDGLDPSMSVGNPELPPLRLVILGDSTATAPGLDDPDDSWPRLTAQHLTPRFSIDLRCLAVGGAKSSDVLKSQVPLALQEQWDIAIVTVGSNDVLNMVPIRRFERHLDRIVEALSQVAGQIILFGVGDLGSIPRLPFPIDTFASGAGHLADRVHRKVAERHGVLKIDQWKLTTAAFNSGLHMFSPDLFHPGPEGHRAWADALIPTVEEALMRLNRGPGEG